MTTSEEDFILHMLFSVISTHKDEEHVETILKIN